MPKFNPKRKTKGQQPESSPSSPQPKKRGTYSRGSSKMTKFYGIIIIAAIATGLFFLLSDYINPPPTIAQWDHVQLHLKIWIYPADGKWNESIPTDYDDAPWYNFTTIYEVSTDTNASVNKLGLPIGIYNKVRFYNVGGKSPAFQILNCTDSDKDKKDDTTGQPADGWGFSVPGFELFVNKIIVVKFEVLAINHVVV